MTAFALPHEHDTQARLAAAEEAARAIVASLPPGTAPDVAWLAGAIYAADTVALEGSVNGVALWWPALGPWAARRLVSWETLLPEQRRGLAERFETLARLCRHPARTG